MGLVNVREWVLVPRLLPVINCWDREDPWQVQPLFSVSYKHPTAVSAHRFASLLRRGAETRLLVVESCHAGW